MHRRQYIPGSHVKLNRTRLREENQLLHERIRIVESHAENLGEALSAWNREAIRRGWRALLDRIRRFFLTPIGNPKAA